MNLPILDDALPGLLDAIRRYPGLPAPTELPVGDFQARLLGPVWFRAFATAGLAVGGLPRWHGKRFRSDGSGINLLRPEVSGGMLIERLPMQLSLAQSPYDGRVVVRVGYDPTARFPWPAVVDELRPFGVHWLGMARTDWRLTRSIAVLRLPFLLLRDA